LVTAFVALPGSAFGQFAVNISIDENCHGLLTNTTGFSSPLTCGFVNDPGPGGLNNAMCYNLLGPPGLVAGDLQIFEIAGTTVLSDILRFDPNVQGGGVFVYSDMEVGDPHPDPADIGFPTGRYTNSLSVTEVGPEGNNGFVYTPTAGQPGFVTGAGGPVTYSFISDAPTPAPEPGTIGLMLGGAALLYWRRRRQA
jgi:hypothetical protein